MHMVTADAMDKVGNTMRCHQHYYNFHQHYTFLFQVKYCVQEMVPVRMPEYDRTCCLAD